MAKSANKNPGTIRSSVDSFTNKDGEHQNVYSTLGKTWEQSGTCRRIEPDCVLPTALKSFIIGHDKDGNPITEMRLVTASFFVNDFIPEEERKAAKSEAVKTSVAEELLAKVNGAK